MATAGPSAFSTSNNSTAAGTVAWTGLGNVFASDTSNATVSLADGEQSNYLEIKGPSLSIPAGATINGIAVNVSRFASVDTSFRYVIDTDVRLLKAGVGVGSSRADTSNHWPTSKTPAKTYGSSSDLWGTTWSPGDFGSGFGISISVFCVDNLDLTTAKVDYADVTVTYTVGGRRRSVVARVS